MDAGMSRPLFWCSGCQPITRAHGSALRRHRCYPWISWVSLEISSSNMMDRALIEHEPLHFAYINRVVEHDNGVVLPMCAGGGYQFPIPG